MKDRKTISEVVEEVDKDMDMKWKNQNKLLKQRVESLEAKIEEYHNFEMALMVQLQSIATTGKLDGPQAWMLRRLLDWDQIPSFCGLKESLLDQLAEREGEV